MFYIILFTLFFILIPSSEIQDINLIYSYSIEENEGVYFGSIRDAVLTPEKNTIVLTSSEQSIFIYNNEGKLVQKLGNEGRGPGELMVPMSIASNNTGDFIVTDIGNAKISVWNNNGDLIREMSTPDNAHMYAQSRSFQSNSSDLFYWTISPDPSSGFDKIRIHKIDTRLEDAELYFSINENSENEMYEFISGWGTWDVSENGDIITVGKTPDYHLYKFGIKDNTLEQFGNPFDPVVRTQKENKIRIENAKRVSSQAASLLSNSNDEKPVFQNIEIDDKNFIWAHRSKVYGEAEEIDIYSIEGEFITTVTLPQSKDEYRLMDIRNNEVLFRVTRDDGRHSLVVYEINYSG